MQYRPLAALIAALSLFPLHTARAQPEGEGAAAEVEPEGPFNAPMPDPSAAVAPTAPEPEFKGNGLLYTAIGVTGLSWLARMTSLGLSATFDRCTSANCDGRLTASIALLYLAPVSQLIATGLVIPGGLLKGRHDGWRSVTTGAPRRSGKTFVIAGGAVFGVFTVLSIALRPVYILSITSCIDNNISGGNSSCGGIGGLVGYHLGAMISDTASTAGAGLMSYGIGFNGYSKRYGSRVSVAPLGNLGAYGLSLSGRF